MVQPQYSLSWDSYQSNICKGFSSLQQNGEFVDMTLAADGYFVKVHQILLAMSSSYLKELLSSAPCQHPVLFLNNLSHKTLSYLLEYIYTGEVLVPADNLQAFMEAAKSLHIKGLENSNENMTLKMATNASQMEEGRLCHVSGVKRMALPNSQKNDPVYIPAAAKKVCIKQDKTIALSGSSKKKKQPVQNINFGSQVQHINYESMDDDCHMQDTDDDIGQDASSVGDTKESVIADKLGTDLQFTLSIRGSLQVILNRFIYNLHSSAKAYKGVRRWRCVDYRNHKCMAFLVTKENSVISRGNLHKHPFHDKKILDKIDKKCVYSAIDEIQGYKEDKDVSNMSDSDFISINDYSMIEKSNDFIKES